MEKALKFLIWYKDLGGNLTSVRIDEIAQDYDRLPLFMSTFKTRSEEIKMKYNHKFN